MTQPVYCTREDVKEALDVKETARADGRIDRAIEAATRAVEALCHRRFYPVLATRYWDWPGGQYARSWRLWLDSDELVSVTTLTSGGVVIPASGYLLEPNRTGPPYNRLEINISTSSGFIGGNTPQRNIALTGLFGYDNTESPAGTVGAAATATATSLAVSDSAAIGVGSIIRIGGERLLVTGKTMADTGVTAGVLTASAANVSITLSGTVGAPIPGETILVDSERMLVIDMAGPVATVKRAWDGSVLAAHAAGTAVYAARALTVTRGALGTTAATMAQGDPVVRWEPPGPVRTLTIAEAMNTMLQEPAGYSRTVRSQAGTGTRSVAAVTVELDALRERVYASHGRKNRSRAV